MRPVDVRDVVFLFLKRFLDGSGVNQIAKDLERE